ncbi:MAG: DnaA ATPase domain-containing protein [Candidatus Porifericomitaceae bacterium WSBS_2022_MAG_OTU9]
MQSYTEQNGLASCSQQVFNFPDSRGQVIANYVPGANEDAVHALKAAVAGQWHGCFYLWGIAGSGKSHLLEAACLLTEQRGIKTAWHQLTAQHGGIGLTEAAAAHDVVCIDDLQHLPQQVECELELLACYEQLHARGGLLFLAADAPPSELRLQLEDVRSRLAAGLVFKLLPLDDYGRLEAMRRRLRARSMDIADDILQILLQQLPRDMHTLFRALDGMVEIATAKRQRLTTQFVHRHLVQFAEPIA